MGISEWRTGLRGQAAEMKSTSFPTLSVPGRKTCWPQSPMRKTKHSERLSSRHDQNLQSIAPHRADNFDGAYAAHRCWRCSNFLYGLTVEVPAWSVGQTATATPRQIMDKKTIP